MYENRHGNSRVSKILIGNKCDLTSKRQVTEDEGLKFAKDHNLQYI
jgi:Ras-related protein Rab-2A